MQENKKYIIITLWPWHFKAAKIWLEVSVQFNNTTAIKRPQEYLRQPALAGSVLLRRPHTHLVLSIKILNANVSFQIYIPVSCMMLISISMALEMIHLFYLVIHTFFFLFFFLQKRMNETSTRSLASIFIHKSFLRLILEGWGLGVGGWRLGGGL